MGYSIEGLREVKDDRVKLFSVIKGFGKVIGCYDQLRLAGMTATEAMLTVSQDVMRVVMAHYLAENDMFKYLTRY